MNILSRYLKKRREQKQFDKSLGSVMMEAILDAGKIYTEPFDPHKYYHSKDAIEIRKKMAWLSSFDVEYEKLYGNIRQ